MAERRGSGLQSRARRFESGWHLHVFRPQLNTRAAAWYAYLRGSNDEPHYGFGASTVEELVEQLNNPAWWPNRWSPHVFERYPGDEDFHFNAPDDADG